MAWTTITSEGGLFPPDLLDELAAGTGDGQREDDFGLERGRLSDEIQSAFSAAQSYWDSFQHRLMRNTEDQHTGLTRNAWMIPFCGLFGYSEGDLVFQRASRTVGDEEYAISFFAGTDEHAPPIHIVGRQYSLDRRPPQGGRSPHALVQEFLNRDEALWGVVTNGYRLRLLRDSQRMTRPTYLEFDLEGMITGLQYSEFALLYRIMHRSRFPRRADDAHTCFLERWFQQGIEQGGRVRDRLRDGVEAALEGLGRSFLQHPGSADLRDDLAQGRLSAQGFERELLRLIYRLLFLMVAEERRLLYSGEPSEEQRVYERHYSASQLRERAALPQMRSRESRRHSDLWQGLLTTFRLFRSEELAQRLGLHALNGELFGDRACRRLESARISNNDLLRAIDSLGRFDDKDVRRRVNYAALDVEELGSVYESLLDFEPIVVDADPERPELWDFQLGAGSGRKSSGSYYTPRELVQELIGSALVPVMEQRLKDAGRDPEKQEEALLSMTVIDPAAGSGHFLLAAARRIARELARVRTGEREPAPEAVRTAMRDVVPSCIYGVDKNEMAVDLCKVGLWIEGHAPGRPLSFLDHHIKHGDSLIGVYDLDVLKDGIPDGAYKALTGDDKEVAKRVKALNKRHKKGEQGLRRSAGEVANLAADYRDLREMPDDTPEAVREKEALYRLLREDGLTARTACDLWTYAFFAPLTEESEALVPTSDDMRAQHRAQVNGLAMSVSREHPYFHWPLEFPDVLDEAGFDVVLGNPPWERYALQEKEWFAGKDDNIANAPNAAVRKQMIAALETGNPPLFADFQAAKHLAEAQSGFTREGGRYPLGAKGQINQYQVFAELGRSLLSQSGMFGVILPTGLATDNNTKELFGDIVARSQLVSLFDFENKFIFPAIHKSYKFSLVTLCGSPRKEAAEFSFFLHQVTDLGDGGRRFYLSAEDIERFNPKTKTLPIFRTRRDAEINNGIYAASGAFEADVRGGGGTGTRGSSLYFTWRETQTSSTDSSLASPSPPGNLQHEQRLRSLLPSNPCWHNRFLRMFDMAADSSLFFDAGAEARIALYEAKMIHQFDHRWATYERGETRNVTFEEKSRPEMTPFPLWEIDVAELDARMSSIWDRKWFVGWGDIVRSTDERTAIAAVLPRVGVGHHIPLFVDPNAEATEFAAFCANFNSFALDYAARQKVGGTHMTFFVMRQLPVFQPHRYLHPANWQPDAILRDWMAERVLELSYTAWDLQPFAQDLGYDGPPFKWDVDRRFEIRCELDAAYFHLYEIERDDVDYIMSTFPIVQRKDEAAHGTYRTRDRILEIYDGMASGEWQSSLDPPVADPRAAHPAE